MSDPEVHQTAVPPEPDSPPALLASGPAANPASSRATKQLRIKPSDILAGLALIISLGSAGISYQQLSSVRHQMQLTELQVRPYVRYKPTFSHEGQDRLTVTMISENLSPIPANVVYDELKTWLDENTTSAFLFSRTGNVLYQHRSGAYTLPQIPKDLATAAISGKVQLMIGTCVVYGSLSPSDHRRWEVRALYSYEPHDELPAVQYMQETDIVETATRCDSRTLRSEWLQKREAPASH
jgi:hypothetical protein